MPLQLDSRAIKAEARSLLHTGEVNPFKLTLFYLLISLVLDTVNAGVSYTIGSAGGFTVLSFSFVSILIGLVSLVLNAGYFCYCFGILRREQMPYDSLFDAFPFAGKVILLSIVEGIFIFLWSMLFVIPGIIAAYRYSFAILNLCENPDLGVMEALDLSKRQTNGYKMQLFLLQLSFIGWSLLVLGVSIFLLAVVWIPHIGTRVNGARRWLSLGFTTFQPSEIAKIAVVLFFSSMICTYKEQMQTFRYGVVPFMVVTVIIVGLLMLEPHLSASIIIMALAIVMMFVGGIKLSYLLVGMGSAGALLLIASKFVPYVHKRIVSWRDPFADTSAAGYQIVQSLYSIGSGGFLGLGLGQSRQKYLYLPEEHNDYIFSIVCEELGYVGAIAILILFALLICRGYWIAAHSPDRYSFLVGIGITTLLSIQVFLNIAVVTNLIPCTGISLPFFSYGGTALAVQLAEVGIVLSVSRQMR